MVKDWNNLSKIAQDYINQRFNIYNINGEKAFNDILLFPHEIKELDSNEIIEILKTKDISHVMPSSLFPELKSDINNIVLEDSSINRIRGAEIMTQEEIRLSNEDYYNDIIEYEDNLDIFNNLPEILMGSTAFGIGVSSFKAYNKVRKKEILLNETPRYIIFDSGGRIIKCAIIGICATSGSSILVTSAFAYTLYKSKNLISNAFKITWNIITHDTTKNIAIGTARTTRKIVSGTAKEIWNIATHDTTKNIAIGTAKTTGKIVSGTAKEIWNVATHDTTKNIAVGTVKTTGKIISGTTKGLWNITKWALNKK
tara:strand:- start:285 stop:1220 length:936 start_codon:yes stop_codon:yes gene_type:complete